MHSISITPQERRRRAAEEKKRIAKNERILKAAGFARTSGNNWSRWSSYASQGTVVVISSVRVQFESIGELVDHVYWAGKQSAKATIREALGL